MRGVFEKQNQFLLRGKRTQGFQGYAPMFHTHAELIYIVSGSIKTTVDGEEHTLLPGELSVIFPYVTHSYEDATQAEALVILAAPEALAFDNSLRTCRPVRHYVDGTTFYPMLARAVELIRADRIKTAQGYVNAVMGEFLELVALEHAERGAGDAAVRILAYCAEHFSENITLHQVSEALYISQSHVSKIFARKFKYGFREYINQLRIDKAKTLLEDPEQKILDVMYACGFQNQSSFNRVFRELCGVSPREYREAVQHRAHEG